MSYNIRMYYGLLIIALLFTLPVNSYAQFWQRVESNNSGTLNGIDFYDGMFGMIAAGNSAILQTTDGGNSWGIHEINRSIIFHDISIISRTAAIAVGIEAIFKTTTSGKHWQRIYTGSDTISSLFSVSFADSSIGIIAGTSYPNDGSQQAIILFTVDGGETWQRRDHGIQHLLTSVYMIDKSTALAGSYQGIYRTTNQGLSWELIDSMMRVDDFHFLNQNYGWSVGWPMAKTTDGGSTWTKVDRNIASPAHGIHILDSLNIICLGSNGEIIRTTDAGITWRVEHINLGFLYGIDCTEEDCFAVGQHGTILRSQRRVSAYDDPTQKNKIDHLKIKVYSPEISIDIPCGGKMQANICDILGKSVAQLWNGDVYETNMNFHAQNLDAGIYFLHVILYPQNLDDQLQATVPVIITR
ncbi:MAG: hypothetical protein JNJ94_00055 [Chlorobi bacterium]|nr:hypothetical protein [Chlorobiota bacterium]